VKLFLKVEGGGGGIRAIKGKGGSVIATENIQAPKGFLRWDRQQGISAVRRLKKKNIGSRQHLRVRRKPTPKAVEQMPQRGERGVLDLRGLNQRAR